MSELRDTIDLPALRAALATAAERSRTLKAALRRRWEEPMGAAQLELHRLRQRTTSLCILRAAMRGRFHLQRPLRAGSWPGMSWNQAEYHDVVIGRIAPEFARTGAARAVQGPTAVDADAREAG